MAGMFKKAYDVLKNAPDAASDFVSSKGIRGSNLVESGLDGLERTAEATMKRMSGSGPEITQNFSNSLVGNIQETAYGALSSIRGSAGDELLNASIRGATAGAMIGAGAGLVSDDMSVSGGALMGGLGGGALSGISSARRSNRMRTASTDLEAAKSDYKNLKIGSNESRKDFNLRGKETYDRIQNLESNYNKVMSQPPASFWGHGMISGAGALAYSTLDSNRY